MERPAWKPPGTPAEELDPPALVADLDVVDRNIAVMHGFFRDRPARLRPFVSAHRCPALAHRQLAAGGTAGGILVASLGEGALFAQHGFHDITILNPVVPAGKVRRLCVLSQSVAVTVNADSETNVRDLSAAAVAGGAAIPVLVALRSGPDRFGVAPEAALPLARVVAASPGLRFAGLSGYGGGEGPLAWFQEVLDARERIEKDGIPVPAISLGNSRSYDIAGVLPGVTEVPAGAYLLSDVRHAGRFTPAARVLTCVISRPEPGFALLNAGHKAMTGDTGLPQVAGPGMRITRMSAEHGFLEIGPEREEETDLGGRLWAVPWDSAHCVNVYDYLHLVRDGRLHDVVPVTARGFYR